MKRYWLAGALVALAATARAQDPLSNAFGYINRMMDRGAERRFVYDEADSGLHWFYPTNWLNPPSRPKGPMNIAIDAACGDRPHSGASCLRIHWDGTPGRGGPWNGVIFDTRPEWGGAHGPSIDLSHAAHLAGWVRASRPGVSVKLFVGGGHDRFKQIFAEKEWIPLPADEWKSFSIDLTRVPKDRLGAVQEGFAIVFDAAHAGGERALDIDLDEIAYDDRRPDVPRFPASYGARPKPGGPFRIDSALFSEAEAVGRNVAYQYDLALCILCWLARGTADDIRRARLVGDGLIHCSENDRFYDDYGLYNGLMAGDAVQWGGVPPRPRKKLSGRVAGWWDPKGGLAQKGGWVEDYRHASTSAGDTAWTIISMAALFDRTGDVRYREEAVRLAQWLRDFCLPGDGSKGFIGGTEGWPRDPEPRAPKRPVAKIDPDKVGLPPVEKRKKFQTMAAYRSTEHNLDIGVAMYHVARITGDKSWEKDSAEALDFVEWMFVAGENGAPGHYIAGELRGMDGKWVKNLNPKQFPLDTNCWSALVFGRTSRTAEGMRWVEEHCGVSKGVGGFAGYAFSPADLSGIWCEGTGQASLAYRVLGNPSKAISIRDELRRIQAASPEGGIVASTVDGLDTGFPITIALPDGKFKPGEWLYFAQDHIGGLAWGIVFTELNWNPYFQIPADKQPPLLPCRMR